MHGEDAALAARDEDAMPIESITAFLDANHVPYEVLHHQVDYTAQETAADTHTPGREFAKTVVLDVGAGHAMAVVPAPYRVDLEKIRQSVGTRQVSLASELEMSQLCPGCDVGAEPPLGNLFNMPVFVDPMLEEDETITFNGGTHNDAIRMRYDDFKNLVHPLSMDLIEAV